MPISLFPRSRRARTAALILALPLIAGCSAGTTATHSKAASSGSSSSDSGSFHAKPPCDYLSAAEASKAIGATVKASEKGGACDYSGANLVGFGTTIEGMSSDHTLFTEAIQSIKEEDGKLTQLPVGDQAYGGRSSFEESVIVRSGNVEIQIADADGQTKNFTKSIAIAKAIIANLGN